LHREKKERKKVRKKKKTGKTGRGRGLAGGRGLGGWKERVGRRGKRRRADRSRDYTWTGEDLSIS
jgi:hypothetical protein